MHTLRKNESDLQVKVIHLCFIQHLQYINPTEAAPIPASYFQIPICPVCLETLDERSSGIGVKLLCDHSFKCSCICEWSDISCQVCRRCHLHNEEQICTKCGISEDIRICVICGFIGCSRHAKMHWRHFQHHFSFVLRTQQIWDYVKGKTVHRHSKGNDKLLTLDEDSTIIGAPYRHDENPVMEIEGGRLGVADEEEPDVKKPAIVAPKESTKKLSKKEKKKKELEDFDAVIAEYGFFNADSKNASQVPKVSKKKNDSGKKKNAGTTLDEAVKEAAKEVAARNLKQKKVKKH